jgi:hypothetical protein
MLDNSEVSGARAQEGLKKAGLTLDLPNLTHAFSKTSLNTPCHESRLCIRNSHYFWPNL